MWELEFFGYPFLELFYNFFLYSLIGWIYESCYVSIHKKRWVNRGFLNGPIIPLYGTAATVIYMAFWQYKESYLLVFVGGIVLASTLEYITSLVMELIFHAKWWDYSDRKLNLNGRICLAASMLWGVLSIIMIEIFQPFVHKLIITLPKQAAEYLGYFVFAIFTADVTITVVHTLQLDKMLSELDKLRQDILEFLESTKIYETKEEWKNKWNIHRFPEFADHIRELIDENTDRLMEYNNREGFELKNFRLDVEKHVRDYIGRFQRKSDRTSIVQKRLLKAFPNMHSVKKDAALKDLREWLQKHKRDMR
jgi:uncharacterized membrane protein